MARKLRKPGRSPANRNAYERVLIVCEGTKTEPNYFNAVIAILKLTSADIDLIHSTHTTPMPIAKYTEDKIEKARKDNNPYDHVFCVIDRDRHINFNKASEIMVKNSIKLARSWPCFEYWLLLHFEYTRTDFGETAKETKSDRCIKALEKRIK
nr:RloB family protein [Pseudomonadota bacterium]